MAVQTFDPKAVAVIYAGKIITGLAPDTFVSIDRSVDTWNMVVGCDGKAARAKQNDKSGTITLTILQTSSSNDDLSAIQNADELTNAGIGPFILRDGSGRTIVTALTTWITKPATVEFGGTVAMRTWVLASDSINFFVGGNS